MFVQGTAYLIRARTPAAAINKEFFVQLGARPLVVQVWALDGSGRSAIAVDGFTAAGQIFLLPTDTMIASHDAGNGITIEDKGFKIGNNVNVFRRNDAELLFIVWMRPGEPRGRTQDGTALTTDRSPFSKIYTLDNNLPLRDEEPHGGGDQYDADIETDGSGRYNPEFSDFGFYRES